MAFFELQGQALRDFDAKRLAAPKPAAPKPTYGLMSDVGSSNGVRTPGWSNNIDPMFDPARQKGPGIASLYPKPPAIEPMFDPAQQRTAGHAALTPKPQGLMGAQQGPMPGGGTLDAHMAAGGSQFGASAPNTANDRATKAADDLGESPFKNLAVNWGQLKTDQMNDMRASIGEQRAAMDRAARVQGAQRGLMGGGDSGIMAGEMARNRENAMLESQRGGRQIGLNIGNQQRDYDMRLAGAEAGWRQGVPSALAAALMIPGSLYGQEQANKGAMLGNQFSERTMDSRVGQQQEAYTGGLLNNQGAEIANGISREQGAVMKDTLERLRRKEEAGIALSDLELKQKKWADDNAWWLGPLMFGGEVVKAVASGAGAAVGKQMAGG